MSGGQCALRLIPLSSTPSSCFLVSCDTCVWFCCVVRAAVGRWIVFRSGSRRVSLCERMQFTSGKIASVWQLAVMSLSCARGFLLPHK